MWPTTIKEGVNLQSGSRVQVFPQSAGVLQVAHVILRIGMKPQGGVIPGI